MFGKFLSEKNKQTFRGSTAITANISGSIQLNPLYLYFEVFVTYF